MRMPAALALVALVSPLGVAARQKDRPCPAEQMNFSAEDTKVDCPIAIPDGIMAALAADAHVLRVLDGEGLPVDRLPRSWFSASVAHLDGRAEQDIIVVATGRLSGANVTTFWVFRPTSSGYKLVLMVAEHDLWVLKKRWKGYRIIAAASMTAVQIQELQFRFQDGQYKLFKDTGWKPIN